MIFKYTTTKTIYSIRYSYLKYNQVELSTCKILWIKKLPVLKGYENAATLMRLAFFFWNNDR